MTEQEVISRLDEGWFLNGDIAEETPFGFINPKDTAGWVPTVPAELVRELFDRGILQNPQSGIFAGVSRTHNCNARTLNQRKITGTPQINSSLILIESESMLLRRGYLTTTRQCFRERLNLNESRSWRFVTGCSRHLTMERLIPLRSGVRSHG
jgi:hypothetical protein